MVRIIKAWITISTTTTLLPIKTPKEKADNSLDTGHTYRLLFSKDDTNSKSGNSQS